MKASGVVGISCFEIENSRATARRKKSRAQICGSSRNGFGVS
jgi:hypothetical protein